MKPKNTNKTQLLPTFLMVDQCKKAKQFWDPKQTLYLRNQCNKLHINVNPHYLSWRAQLHFELSNVVNGQKFKKLLTLNKAQENLWAIYHGPIGVKLLTPLSVHQPLAPQRPEGTITTSQDKTKKTLVLCSISIRSLTVFFCGLRAELILSGQPNYIKKHVSLRCI